MKQSAYSYGCDVLGATVIGAFDIARLQDDMNGIKPVTVAVAQALLKGGQQVIVRARATADEKKLPGGTNRDEVYWKLQWHQGALAGLTDYAALYGAAADLKKWVMQAFIEANAVEEGAAYIDAAWQAMKDEIAQRLADLPAAVAKKLSDAEDKAESALSWLPWALGIAGVVAAVAIVGPIVVPIVVAKIQKGRRR